MKQRWLGILVTATALAVGVTSIGAAQVRRPYNPNPNTVRLRIGEFEPDGESLYWEQRERDFTGRAEDFEDTIFGGDYVRMLSERWGVLLSASRWEGEDRQAFRDFVDNFGNEIEHDASLEITSLGVGVVVHILRRTAVVSPYVGGGLGYYAYDLEESGDFIDFDTFEVFPGTFRADGDAFGGFFLLGLEIPITRSVGIFGEGRWHSVDDDLTDDFEGFGDIDLGGREIAAGVSVRF